MSDRFRCRFWHKKKQKYIAGHGYYINYDNGQIYTIEGSMNVTDRITREFCTGLNDKNGTLIYEGDILDEKYKMAVWFLNGAFWVRGKGHGSMLLASYITNRVHAKTHVKVIGNKFQNPELLE